MIDLATVTCDTFVPHVGTQFAIALDDGELVLDLVAADALPKAPDAPRAPFALQFRSTLTTGYLPQRIYALTHPALGTLEVFLVPRGPEATGMRYEAVFG